MKGQARLRLQKTKAMQQILSQRRECADCGSTTNLTFHHLDKKEKSFTIGSATHERHLVGSKKLQAEIDKCVCLCDTCHRRREKQEQQLDKHVEESSNGRTAGFEPVNEGSTPSSSAKAGVAQW